MNVEPKFKDGFDNYVCQGDTIETEHNGIVYVARVEHDDTADAPDEMQDGFWPSLDPTSAGYIGPKSRSTLRRHTAQAQRIMDAWRNDEWFFCGIIIAAFIEDEDGSRIELLDHASSLWGIECNYPSRRKRPNAYLDECADELLGEAIEAAEAAKARLHKATA